MSQNLKKDPQATNRINIHHKNDRGRSEAPSKNNPEDRESIQKEEKIKENEGNEKI